MKHTEVKKGTANMMVTTANLNQLMERLGYTFTDTSLIELALTHRSYHSKQNYERLEFLGDALLGMIIGEALYHKYPKQDEGVLTRMRATLVRQQSLVIIAQDLDLSNFLVLGAGERKAGGKQRASILADVVEALIGAIYLDSGDITVAKSCVLSWYVELIETVNTKKVLKDAKSRLQELLQSKKFVLPEYELIKTQGNAPNQVFIVKCHVTVDNCQDVVQSGESIRIAEQKSADIMINQLSSLL